MFINVDNFSAMNNYYINTIEYFKTNLVQDNMIQFMFLKQMSDFHLYFFYKWWIDNIYDKFYISTVQKHNENLNLLLGLFIISVFFLGYLLIYVFSMISVKLLNYENNFLNMIPLRNGIDIEKVERYLNSLELA